jgi:hypothetical protein
MSAPESSRPALKNYLPAVACALTPLLCYFVIRPYAEIGMIDDWAYIKIAQVLAQTGHLVYNGWEAAMVGWQAYFGALLIKLFGFSFTAVRFTTVIEAMVTAFLLERIGVRAGLNAWNATLVTLIFIFSPIFFPLAYTFMSDVPGVFVLVVCLYMCLRTVQAESERSAMVWICLAALVNAVGGTARQIAWLGVLVMVPCTLWLLRRSRRVVVAGAISWLVAVSFVAAAMHWFARQPYILPQALLPSRVGLKELESAVRIGLRYAGDLALLALPVLLMFARSLRAWNRRMVMVFAAGWFCFAVAAVALAHARKLRLWLAPFNGDIMSDASLQRLNVIADGWAHVSASSYVLYLLLTAVLIFGVLSFVTSLLASGAGPGAAQKAAYPIRWRQLGILLGPISAAYMALLGSMILQDEIFAYFDRYLSPLLAFLLLVLACYYQQTVKAHLPVVCILLIGILGAFSVAATHDRFSMYRGWLKAIDQVRATGTPATAIGGPFEFEAWTETETVGYANDARIRNPPGAYVPPAAKDLQPDCRQDSFSTWVPAIKPVYAISLTQGECGGQPAFPTVTYRTWIAPHTNSIYTVRIPSPVPR